MSTNLTATEILDIRDQMAEFARKLDNFRIVHSSEISALLFSELENWSRTIKDRVFELTGQALKKLNTDLNEPADKIKEAIGKLEEALKTIEKFNKVLDDIASIITIFGVIVRAASTGIGSANIASAFSSLNDLLV